MALRIEMNTYGSSNVLVARDVPIPEPGAGEVVIKVAASAVNRADIEIRSGKWPIQSDDPFPNVLGLETCGIIHQSGPEVELLPGTNVITMMQKMSGIHGIRPGGYQEYVCVPADVIAVLPPDCDLLAMAAFGLGAVTAWHGLARLHLSKDDRVVIMGGRGGVGANAIGIANALGAVTIAPTRHREQKHDLLAIGAHEVWDISSQSLKDAATGDVDAVLDIIGGDIFSQSLQILRKPGGRLCSIGALKSPVASISIWDLMHELTVTGWSSENLNADGLQKAIDKIQALHQSGALQVPPYQTFRIEDVALVHDAIAGGKITGRALLTPE